MPLLPTLLCRSNVARLAAELEHMSATQEQVVQELTRAKQEDKEKSLRIARLEDALQRANGEQRKLVAKIMIDEER